VLSSWLEVFLERKIEHFYTADYFDPLFLATFFLRSPELRMSRPMRRFALRYERVPERRVCFARTSAPSCAFLLMILGVAIGAPLLGLPALLDGPEILALPCLLSLHR